MCREQEIVEPHRRLGRVRMTSRILPFYRWRVEEAGGGDGVASETEDVEGGEVDGEAERGFAQVVRYGLRVEG